MTWNDDYWHLRRMAADESRAEADRKAILAALARIRRLGATIDKLIPKGTCIAIEPDPEDGETR